MCILFEVAILTVSNVLFSWPRLAEAAEAAVLRHLRNIEADVLRIVSSG